MYNDQVEVTALRRGASIVLLDGSKRRGRGSPSKRYNFKLFVAMLLALIPGIVSAGTTDVIKAKVACQSDSTCLFTVTLSHADTGWDHYADRWEVLSLEGEVLGTRILYHPHVHEQPFTRSLAGVRIPPSTKQVRIRARDSVHGYGGKEIIVDLPL